MQLISLNIAVFVSLLLHGLPLSSATKQSSKPHIIFIVADDLVSHMRGNYNDISTSECKIFDPN